MKIRTKKDNFVHLIDYKEGKFFKEGFYHNKCYNDTISGTNKMQGMALGLLKRATKVMDNLDGGVKEYEIPH